jgi:hypothetical protein
MLRRLNNKTVCGAASVVFVPHHIHHIRYTEGEKVACVEMEGGNGPDNQVNWLIYSRTLRGWEHPSENEEMPELKRQEILGNLSKSLDLLAMPHQIV